MPNCNEEPSPHIEGEPQVCLNGEPCDFSEFYAPAEVEAWFTGESANNSDNATETQENNSEPQLKPGDYVPGEVRRAFMKRIYLGDLEQVRQSKMQKHSETGE